MGNPVLLPILPVSHRRGSCVRRHVFPGICVIRKYVANTRRNAPKGRLRWICRCQIDNRAPGRVNGVRPGDSEAVDRGARRQRQGGELVRTRLRLHRHLPCVVSRSRTETIALYVLSLPVSAWIRRWRCRLVWCRPLAHLLGSEHGTASLFLWHARPLKNVFRAHAALDEGVGEGSSDSMSCPPPCAVGRDDDLRRELCQRLNGWPDDRLGG